MDRSSSQQKRPRIRRDGWTAERQLAFLAALARTRSVAKAARAVGMSRESAYRLRERPYAALFAAIWDEVVQQDVSVESHNAGLSDGQISRLLGTHFRRKCGDFFAIGSLRIQPEGR
jgi:hypothetical protein